MQTWWHDCSPLTSIEHCLWNDAIFKMVRIKMSKPFFQSVIYAILVIWKPNKQDRWVGPAKNPNKKHSRMNSVPFVFQVLCVNICMNLSIHISIYTYDTYHILIIYNAFKPRSQRPVSKKPRTSASFPKVQRYYQTANSRCGNVWNMSYIFTDIYHRFKLLSQKYV